MVWLNQKWNNDKCRYGCNNPKEQRVCKRSYIWNPATCSCENGKHVENIIGDSVITCDEIIEETIPRKSTATTTVVTKCTSTNFYTLLAFLLMTIALLRAVSIYSYLIIYQTKQNLCYLANTPLAN